MKKLVLCAFSLMTLLVLTGCDSKDSCLDQGGSYDEASETCSL